jgi:hypothetical protein
MPRIVASKPPAFTPPPRPAPADEGPLRSPPLSKAAWRALGIGFAIAFVIWLVPYTNLLFDPLTTIIHELGHTLFAWSYGYQAVPAFDFSEGGGVSLIPEERSIPIVVGVYLVLAILLWRVRRHPPTVIALLLMGLGHSLVMWSSWHQGVILAMGHGMELVFAAVFLYRAMTGTTLLQADERPAYAMVGFLILLNRVSFFHKLATDGDFQAWYLDGKSYADNDLVQIADFFWKTSIAHLAQLFVVACFLMPFVARLFYRFEGPMWRCAARFIQPDD